MSNNLTHDVDARWCTAIYSSSSHDVEIMHSQGNYVHACKTIYVHVLEHHMPVLGPGDT